MKIYFKKFSIMFFMLLTVIVMGAIQHGIMANAATVQQQLTAPESGWTRYDDTNSNIKYIGTWNYWPSGDSHSTNDYNKTAHANTKISDTIKFNFKGSKIRIIGENRADAYYADNNVYIDGVNIGNFRSDGYSKTTNNYTGMIMQYEMTGLDFTEHTVEIKCTRNSYWYFDAIDIDSTGQILPYNELMSLDKPTMDLNVGESGELTAITTPSAVSANVRWSSSDSNIATVTTSGQVTVVGGIKEGTCTITATTDDGLIATCTVNVTKVNESISLDQSSMDLTVGDSGQLTATTTPAAVGVTWNSSDSSVATADSTGKVTAVSAGTCTITATTADGLTATCTVTVTKENESISLNKSTTNLTTGDSETLVASTTPSAVSVTWSSSDSSVATVDSTGKVTAVGTGTATITATTADGSNLSASCAVTVTSPTEPTDPTSDGTLYIELVDGNIKSYDVTATEITNFMQWYKDRDNTKSESPYYKFTKGTYTDYVVHDQIDWFEVR